MSSVSIEIRKLQASLPRVQKSWQMLIQLRSSWLQLTMTSSYARPNIGGQDLVSF